MIVPPKYVQEKGDEYFNTHPVGTGPFKFVEYTPRSA
jgi:peptide/nickel transport system substrate-binding protein